MLWLRLSGQCWALSSRAPVKCGIGQLLSAGLSPSTESTGSCSLPCSSSRARAGLLWNPLMGQMWDCFQKSESSARNLRVWHPEQIAASAASIYSGRFCCLSRFVSKQGVKASIINNRPQISQDPPAQVENISFFFFSFKKLGSFILSLSRPCLSSGFFVFVELFLTFFCNLCWNCDLWQCCVCSHDAS